MTKDFEHPYETSQAVIGSSISIKGEVSGSENLLVLGSIEGTINLKENTVTVGKGARVNANIFGNIIHVEGEVTGDLKGKEQVVVHKTGHVRGNIASPRLSLEDGAKLKGSIDTEAAGDVTVSDKHFEKKLKPSTVIVPNITDTPPSH